MTAVHEFATMSEALAMLPAMLPGELAQVPGIPSWHEKAEAWIVQADGQPRRVRACVIPPDHPALGGGRPEPMRGAAVMLVANASHMARGSQQRVTRVVAERSIEQERADEKIARDHADTVGAAELAKARPELAEGPNGRKRLSHRRRLKTFRPMASDKRPWVLLGEPDIAELRIAMMNVFWDLVSLGDYHTRLGVASLKVAEMFMRGLEMAMSNCETTADGEKERIKALNRSSMNGEIDLQQIEQAERRIEDMRLQYWHFSQLFGVWLGEYSVFRQKLDVRMPPYRTQAEHRQWSREQYESRKRRREFELSLIRTKDEASYRRWLADQEGYAARLDGIIDGKDASEGGQLEATSGEDEDAGESGLRPVHRQSNEQTARLDGSPD